jgi:hypothetical protein
LKNLEPDVLWLWKFSKLQPEVNNKIKDLHNTGANQGKAMPSLQKWLKVSPNLRPWSSIAIGNVKSCLNSFSLAERSWWVNAHFYPTWVMTEHLISTFIIHDVKLPALIPKPFPDKLVRSPIPPIVRIMWRDKEGPCQRHYWGYFGHRI